MKTVPTYEKTVHAALADLYTTLSELKNNRTKYLSSKQVHALYEQFLEQVHELLVVRKDEELKGMTLSLPTPTDLVIEDVWQLLLLSFVTCGLTKFAPATYLSLSTVYKLLTHLKECQVYLVDDLRPIGQRLGEIRAIIDADDDEDDSDSDVPRNHKAEESLLLRTKWSRCQAAYQELQDTFDQMPRDLDDAYTQLIHTRQALLNYVTLQDGASGVAPKLSELKAQLRQIGALRDESGKFRSAASEKERERAQMVLDGLYDDCNNLLNDLDIQHGGVAAALATLTLDMLDTEAEVLDSFREVYDELLALKRTLEKLLVTRRWTLRETDLYTYQKLLKLLDERRVALNGLLADCSADAAKKIRRVQLLLLYLLRRCYSLIYKLLESLEPVLESLQPIHNQLSTVRRCLLEIKRVDGLNNLRELYPFQFKLALLDNLRQDGKFVVNGQVPEGQGTLTALLAECFDIIHELKIELEEKEEQDDVASDDDKDDITDEEDKGPDDEVELKRNRYKGFNEADYDMDSEDDDLSSLSDSEFESNDYY